MLLPLFLQGFHRTSRRNYTGCSDARQNQWHHHYFKALLSKQVSNIFWKVKITVTLTLLYVVLFTYLSAVRPLQKTWCKTSGAEGWNLAMISYKFCLRPFGLQLRPATWQVIETGTTVPVWKNWKQRCIAACCRITIFLLSTALNLAHRT